MPTERSSAAFPLGADDTDDADELRSPHIRFGVRRGRKSCSLEVQVNEADELRSQHICYGEGKKTRLLFAST
jgi:hypothetical protein